MTAIICPDWCTDHADLRPHGQGAADIAHIHSTDFGGCAVQEFVTGSGGTHAVEVYVDKAHYYELGFEGLRADGVRRLLGDLAAAEGLLTQVEGVSA